MSSTLSHFAPRTSSPSRTARSTSAAPAVRTASALRVPLSDVGAYHESLIIEPTLKPQGSVAVRFESRLDTARIPTETQIRYRCTLGRDALLRLREAIDAVLAAQERLG